jgi:2,5-furandicarboxylate decarboxylase 1
MSLSARQDLRQFLADYRRSHPEDVLTVQAPLRREQDVTAVVEELERQGRQPLLEFTDVEGLGVPVVTNVFASRLRVARMLGAAAAADLHGGYQRGAGSRRPLRQVSDGPVLEVLEEGDELDVRRLPLLTHFADDLGPYLTSGVFVAADPDTGIGNLSYHRAIAISATELATSLHSRGDLWRYLAAARRRGEPLPVAIVIGAHPLFLLAASARVGVDVDEREIAGGLFGEPLEVVRTPGRAIAVPATAEIVLEGVIEPDRSAPEGPFGEFSGYSSDRSTNDVVRVERVLRRRDPILLDISPGRAPDHLNLARIPREAELVQALRERFADVVAVYYPASGTHFHAYVAVRPSRPGAARQVLLALLGWDPYLKTAIAVDDDVDVERDGDVLWAIATRVQPHADVFVVDGLPGSPLDPSSSPEGTTSRLAIDATRAPGFDAPVVRLDAAAVERARAVLAPSSPDPG